MPETEPFDRAAVHAEMERAKARFHLLLDGATRDDLRRPSDGTRWTNEELLFHMLFGYVIVRALLVVMSVVSRLPMPVRRGFGGLLNASARPFDVVNFWGSRIGARIVGRRMGARFDGVIASLQRHLDQDSEAALRRAMPYPTRWDPFFTAVVSRADLYHYGTQHFDFHARQLSLLDEARPAGWSDGG